MRGERSGERRQSQWAAFRFSIIGPLLSAPPERGALRGELARLASKLWQHPVSGESVRFSVSTLERWYYKARNARQDPVGALSQRPRKDRGRRRAMSLALEQAVLRQYEQHVSWSYKLHFDNLSVVVAKQSELGGMVSYATLRRFMKSHGLVKQPRRRTSRPGEERARQRLEEREVRSFEAEYVNALWHLDFHHGSRLVLLSDGRYVKPFVFAVLDDHSRLCCHVQWYLGETAENLVHGLCQAFQKRGLPRALMSDNGSAMLAGEVEHGLVRLGVVHETTLPYSPYQNGKQECFWASLEGRLMAMLEGVRDLTLSDLNEATLAWAEMEYNRKLHTELGESPLERFVSGRDLGRPSPSSEDLRRAFTAELSRSQRKSDGTASLEGVRFEIPSRYRVFDRVTLRHASWDLSHVWLVDARSGKALCRIYPLDKAANASGKRRLVEPILGAREPRVPSSGIAPLLRKLLEDYAATGLPPAYLPQVRTETPKDPS